MKVELTETQRQQIFAALVETQDAGVGVADSRQMVAAKYSIGVEQVRKIEREGLDFEWPPL